MKSSWAGALKFEPGDEQIAAGSLAMTCLQVRHRELRQVETCARSARCSRSDAVSLNGSCRTASIAGERSSRARRTSSVSSGLGCAMAARVRRLRCATTSLGTTASIVLEGPFSLHFFTIIFGGQRTHRQAVLGGEPNVLYQAYSIHGNGIGSRMLACISISAKHTLVTQTTNNILEIKDLQINLQEQCSNLQ